MFQELGRSSQVVALVNHYDRMLQSGRGGGLTPHETLSIIFAQHKARFDSVVLALYPHDGGLSPAPSSIGE